ncbi:MAG: hypothetical protein QM765_47655 [Myxococcales bacterium]
MAFDTKRFAWLANHLQSLPAGLDSHPECKAKGTLVRSYAAGVPVEKVRGADLPAPVEALFLTPPANSAWVPEVVSWAGIFAVADLLGLDEPGFARWMAAKNRELFTNPVMRVVMNFTSPTLALALSSAYWGVIHHGSRLKLVGSEELTARVALDYPDRLFGEKAAQGLAVAFTVALELSRARRPNVSLERWTPTESTFVARWA